MPERKIVLFRFDIPELGHLPTVEQERIIDLCWRSVAVQRAWKHYWNRPIQLLLIPIMPLAVYFALTNKSTAASLAILLPLAVIFVFSVRAAYRKRLKQVMRQLASACLRGEQLKLDETIPAMFGPTTKAAAKESSQFQWREYRGKLILMAVLWVVIIALLLLLRLMKQKGY